jgi:glycogen operon protein
VDGFRFDLATTLARDGGRYDPGAAVLDAIGADPVLGAVKLIAEPWDVGPDGYVLGRFPVGWSEWNAQYRDTVRDYWRGRGRRGAFAAALAGSADVYRSFSRGPLASVNLVTAHDGYTLTDLVSYERRHNQANGEANNDGHGDNRSWNCGVEGPSDDPAIVELRARQRRNFLATLFCSLGVPMLLGGDELGRTQAGNNNAYCQDNELSWLDWEGAVPGLAAWVGHLTALRRRHPVLRRRRWPDGHARPGTGAIDLSWFGPDGLPLDTEEWWAEGGQVLVACYDGRALDPVPDDLAAADPPPEGVEVTVSAAPSLLIITNSAAEDTAVTVPSGAGGRDWRVALDSARPDLVGGSLPPGDRSADLRLVPGETLVVAAHSIVLLE